jgi:hypothetical protein
MCTFGEAKNHQQHGGRQRDLSILTTKGMSSSTNSECFPILNLDYAVVLLPNAVLIENAQRYIQSTWICATKYRAILRQPLFPVPSIINTVFLNFAAWSLFFQPPYTEVLIRTALITLAKNGTHGGPQLHKYEALGTCRSHQSNTFITQNEYATFSSSVSKMARLRTCQQRNYFDSRQA